MISIPIMVSSSQVSQQPGLARLYILVRAWAGLQFVRETFPKQGAPSMGRKEEPGTPSSPKQ